ncbi:hypothetical protein EVA_13476 [gut metagenome]|uniref:Uncharacterized protein n=1 Tax=gut metagenome TaxID=749906 RepID=J9FTX1_9ZZZZ
MIFLSHGYFILIGFIISSLSTRVGLQLRIALRWQKEGG